MLMVQPSDSATGAAAVGVGVVIGVAVGVADAVADAVAWGVVVATGALAQPASKAATRIRVFIATRSGGRAVAARNYRQAQRQLRTKRPIASIARIGNGGS
jgi:hypothetical protein